ncbi:Amine oxidase [Pleurostoma richardsiae]|uniref:Amine oxidase n=1 Tax=Pleurostoma richardsiae TaxID=41990 RepID=A0AA38VDR7_9PEZI|nr:Amine oxidase [Pleurostoma richardsiae]
MSPNHSGYTSRDGFQWTKETGLRDGVPSLGVIRPSSNLTSTTRHDLFDVVVIGGGYAGLTAIRDLTLAGHKVLLIEARDRIGGRSWSANIQGYPYEMGGTWIHWNQPFIWRELFRYGLSSKIDISPVKEGGLSKCLVNMEGTRTVKMSHDKEDDISESAIKKFVNVDGRLARTVIPFPHDPHYNREAVAHYDKMSLADRFVEVADEMTPLERSMFEAFLSITCGSRTWEEASFFEFLRWWALMNYNYTDFIALGLTYKFKCGQSGFARHFFDEALETGNLTYVFDSPVSNVVDREGTVKVTTTARGNCGVSATFQGYRVICTVPLNVLYKVDFSPPLPQPKMEASKLGHVNQVTKVHAEVANPELRSVGAFSWPTGKLTYGFGDGTTPAGNTHMVAFGGAHPGVHLQPEENMDETLAAWRDLLAGHKVDIRRVVFHNWHKDEFALGAWEWLRPNMSTKYLDPLRARHGNVLFGSADWAMGWRGFIDGAIEDGGRVAKEASTEIRMARRGNATTSDGKFVVSERSRI